MPSRLRRALRATTIVAMLAAVALSPTKGADALEADPVKYDPSSGEPESHHVDTVMVASDGGEINTPDECALVPSCTMVPLEITPLPERGEDEDWVVRLDVAWDAENIETPNNLAGSQGSSDLDVYMYHWGPLFDDEGEPEMNDDGTQAEGYIETGRSASGENPEIFKLFRPVETEYWLVVQNFLGVNEGFDLNFSFTDTSFGGIGDFGIGSTSTGPATPAPSDGDRLSFGDQPARPFAAPVTPAPPTPAATAYEDDDFGFASSLRDDLLAADEGPVRGSLFAEDDLAPPADVGTSTLLLWLGLFPLLLVGAAIAFLVRRRPSTLSIRFPGRAVRPEPVIE